MNISKKQIQWDQWNRPYIQEHAEYDASGNLIKAGGRFMLPLNHGLTPPKKEIVESL